MDEYANFKITTATKKIMSMDGRINVVRGGTSASKTYSIMGLLQSIAEIDAGCVISVVSESIPHLKRGAVRDFLSIMKDVGVFVPENWNKQTLTYTFFNESIMEFITVDEDTARGGRRDYLFVNEANLLSWNTFSELEIRTRKKIWIDYNPVSTFWADNELIGKRDDVEFLKVTYIDNEALDLATKQAIEARRGDGKNNWWLVYGLGEIGSLEGNVYSGWIPVDSIPEGFVLKRYGQDYGWNDPIATIAVYENDNGDVLLDEMTYEFHMSTPRLIELCRNMPEALFVGDNSRPEIINEMESNGIRIIGCDKTPGEKMNGKRYNIELVARRKIFYTRRSKNLEQEYLTYAWRTKRATGETIDEPNDGNDHAMDAVAYAIRDLERKPIQYGGIR